MAAVLRRVVPLVLALPLLAAACGGGGSPSAAPAQRDVDLSRASARTMAGGSARFTLAVAAQVAGMSVRSDERGTVSFTQHRAHVYKLVPGGGLPQESIVDGPFTYTNANIQAAIANPSVPPWTKLDNRRLSDAQRRNRIDDLEHVRALAYLAAGVADAKRVGNAGGSVHVRGRVEPKRLLARVPAAERGEMRAVIHSDYVDRPFPADFWLDANDRVRRVRVDYRTPKGGRIAVEGTFSGFGTRVDVTLPPASEIQDISP